METCLQGTQYFNATKLCCLKHNNQGGKPTPSSLLVHSKRPNLTESPGTSPQRPPLTSHPGTICLFVFFYKVSRPTLPRIPEYPSLNFPRQSSLPQVEYHSPSTEGSSATKGKETCPLGMQVSLDWIGIKITPLSSSQLSSRISAIHLYCLKSPPPGRQSNSRESLTDNTKHSTASSLHTAACPVLYQISESQDSYIDRCLGRPRPAA